VSLRRRLLEAFTGFEGPNEVDFPVKQIRASDLRDGMILVAMPRRWAQPEPPSDGGWPIVSNCDYFEHGEPEGGHQAPGSRRVPCVYWDTDEPGPDSHYWCYADTLVTIAVESPRQGKR
jgi:hypothetical protein